MTEQIGAVIELSGVEKTYRTTAVAVPAIRGVSLTVHAGEFLAVMGPSGCGKSTLLHLMGLLDSADAGEIRLDGRDVTHLSEQELAKVRNQRIGFVFQKFNLLPRYSALENVALPQIYGGHTRAADPAVLLAQVGLAERARHMPNELSGGQQQRVAIARALVNRPAVLLADEPTGNLDSASATEIMERLRELNAAGLTIVMVTHEADVAAYASRVVSMRDGRIESDRPQGTMRPRGLAAVTPEYAPAVAATRGWRWSVYARQAIRALRANKTRSALSTLGILIGVAAVVGVVALGAGARRALQASLANLGTNLLMVRPGAARTGGVSLGAGTVTRLTVDDAHNIAAQVPGVVAAAPVVDGRVQGEFGNKNWNTQVIGTTPEYASMRAAVPERGRFFTEAEDRRRARVAVVGRTVVRELMDGGEPLGAEIKLNRVGFTIIGVLPAKGTDAFHDQDDVVIIPAQTAMRRLLGVDYVNGINVQVDTIERMPEVEDAIRRLLVARHRLRPEDTEAFRIRNLQDIQTTLRETNRTMAILLAAIAAVSMLVGGIGIMNMMLVTVTERTREIGLHKALGATRADVMAQFLIEAIVISAAGGLAGLAAGASIAVAVSRVAGWDTVVSPGAGALAVGFAVSVGLIFGLWPAYQAARLAPIDALRYE